ncbi:MAG: hypothetical protein GY719_23305 [bacterium]|nr:hypothetical protein [bacterium]
MWTSILALFVGLGLNRLVDRLTSPAGEPGFADHLLWGLPLSDDRTLLNVDGSLSTAWSVGCPDHMSCTEGRLVEIGRTVNQAFMPLVDQWLLNFDVLRVPAPDYPPAGAFPEAVSSQLDDERRRRFSAAGHNFISRQVLIATYSPPPPVYDRTYSFFIDQPGPTQSHDWRRSFDSFRQDVERLEQQLGRVFEMTPLSTPELASHLRCCLTGQLHPVAVPSGVALRDLLVNESFTGGFHPRIGDRNLRVVAVTGFPSAPRSDAFEVFHSVAFPCRSSHRIYPLSRRVGESLLARHRLLWFNKGRGLTRSATAEVFADAHAGDMARDAADAVREISSGSTRYAAYSWSFVVTDPTFRGADEKARHLVERFSAQGFPASVETLNAAAAFIGSLPPHGRHNVRLPLISLRNIADLLGTTSPHLGAAYCPSALYPPDSPPILWAITEETTPYRLHLIHNNVPHGLILGMTRAGKSVLLGLLALQALRWADSQVFLFDVDYSSAFLTLACSGRHYDIAGEGGDIHFQPLAQVDEPAELQWALTWLLQLLQLQSVEHGPHLERDLQQALELLAREPAEQRTLTLLRSYTQLDEVKAALRPYTAHGAHGHLLDASADGLATGRLQVFEMTHLMRSSDRTIAIPVMLYLFHRIEQRLREGRPSHVFIEEAWLPLLDTSFAARIDSWLRRLAKLNAGVWLVTQSPQEVVAAANAKVVLDSCASRIFLPDPHATDPGSRDLYARLGLNAKEIELLAAAEPRRHYLHSTPSGSRLFELALDPLALALLTPRQGKTVFQMYQLAAERRARLGDGWFRHYLEELGLSECAQRLATSETGAAA